MRRVRRHWAANVLVAVLAAFAAAIARSYLSSMFDARVSVLAFLPAIAFSAWLGGFVPGLTATLLSAVAYVAWPEPAHHATSVEVPLEELRIAMLVGTGVLISSLYGRLRVARHRLEARFGRAQLMLEAARRLSGTLEAKEIHDGLRELVARALPLDGMVISAYDPETRIVRCVYGWVNGHLFDHTTLPPLTIDLEGEGMQTAVIRSGKGRIYADVRARVRRQGRYFDVDPQGKVRDLSRPDTPPTGSRCALMVPLKLEGRVVGVVQVMSDTPGVYGRDQLDTLETIVAPIAVALQNAELYARAKREIEERLRVEQMLTVSEERLLEADRRKDEFLATLAHELRNPLAPILNAVALLRGPESEPDRIGWSREVIERQVGHMARLLDDLLDVSRVSRGRLRLLAEPVDLSEVVRHAVEASQPLIDAGHHHLTLALPHDPITLEADPTRLAQVFSNLLNNAARYSETGTAIHLSAERVEGDAVVRVVDHGIGISASMLPRIFEAFLQIDHSLERSQGGLGIGLTLVKQIVDMHGGRVEAHSDGLGKGSVFTVRLPLPAVAPEAPFARKRGVAGSDGADPLFRAGLDVSGAGQDGSGAGRDGSDPSAARKRRILIADDLEDSAESLALLLIREGHEVRTAHDGAEAVGVARSFLPEVVLLDIAMPKLNGYEAARRILDERRGRRPVLIALTGWGHEENRMRTREAGFDHHLVKPVEPEALARLLSTVEV
jgi:signal transduction histidine kinase